jgi:hypothetical protein
MCKRARSGFWAIALLPLLLSSCSSSSPSPASSTARPTASQGADSIASNVEVELDIFSGRPNPVWTLSGVERTQFLEKLAALPGAPPLELATNLGYRGFILRITNSAEQSVVRIQRGKVHVVRAGKDLYYTDPNRGLERWLLQSGRASLDPSIYAIVERELSG